MFHWPKAKFLYSKLQPKIIALEVINFVLWQIESHLSNNDFRKQILEGDIARFNLF